MVYIDTQKGGEKMDKIDDVFISHASDILADTNSGLSG